MWQRTQESWCINKGADSKDFESLMERIEQAMAFAQRIEGN
jgi:hypothetical protein